jgi:starvation-inducible DNA-binding protein
MPAKRTATKTASRAAASTPSMSTALVPTPKPAALLPTRIHVSTKAREQMGRVLNARLADLLDLERQAKQAHWNVRGPRFQMLHELFDDVAELAVKWADDVAERALQLGVIAEGTSQAVVARSQLAPAPLRADHADAWIGLVADALATCANAIRKDIDAADKAKDAITADLFTRITGEADKQLWFVESHLLA